MAPLAPTFASRLIERLAPWNPGGGGGVVTKGLLTSTTLTTSVVLLTEPVSSKGSESDLERFAQALGAMFQPLLLLAEESGEDGVAGYVPAWGKLLDPVNAPGKALAYLGQFVGVEVPKGASEGEARALVKAEAGLERGTRKSIEEAIRRTPAAAGVEFTIQERTNAAGLPSAYAFNIALVANGFLDAGVKTAIVREVEPVKPAGLVLSVQEVGFTRWLHGTKKWSEISAGRKWTEMTAGTF